MQLLLKFIVGFFLVLISAILSTAPEGCGGRIFTVGLHREFSSPAEEALIMQAESVCPPYADVADSFVGEPPVPSEQCLWWSDTEAGGTYLDRVPYAITSEAIDFFANRVLELEQEPESEVYDASVHYEARVEYGWVPPDNPSGPAPVVVKMKLSFWFNTNVGSVTFSLERIVAFDDGGSVMRVYGDGDIEVDEYFYYFLCYRSPVQIW